MHFRQLKVSNDALLAKQGWRHMNRTNSFLASFIKAMYYPNGDFKSSTLGYAPGFSKSLLLKGIPWQVAKLLRELNKIGNYIFTLL